MIRRLLQRRPRISVVVIFYNMQREAPRTLYSLTTAYQQGVAEGDYEVIAVDSNSTEPLDKAMVESMQSNFQYHYVKADNPSPCTAINHAIGLARGEYICCLIDGARILSPNILSKTLEVQRLYPKSFVYTIGMHLGPKVQNESIAEGYNQKVEDKMLTKVDWREDGYELFKVSSLAGSSKSGFLYPIAESNCFTIDKRSLLAIGGFDPRFVSPGGGVVNLDVFKRLSELEDHQLIMLLSEATFHQVHGGVATNAQKDDHPVQGFMQEYRQIRGEDYEIPQRIPLMFGEIHPNTRRFMRPEG